MNPHFYILFPDGVYTLPPPTPRPEDLPSAPIFHPAPKPTQADVEVVAERTRKRILRYLEKRDVVTFAAAPGDAEVIVVIAEGFGEADRRMRPC